MKTEEFRKKFTTTFWQLRAESLTKDSSDDCWQPLVSLAEEYGSDSEKQFALAAKLHDSSADESLKICMELLPTIEEYLKGYCYFIMGSLYNGKQKSERAIEYYKKALEAPNFNTIGNALNNMGIAYSDLDNHEKAIECYKRALEDPNYNTPGNALINMGNAHSDLNNHEKAIEYYKKALEDPNINTPGEALFNMGNTYFDLNKHEKAIEYYKKALEDPNYKTHSDALFNMGNTYREFNNNEKAIEYYQKTLEDPNYNTPGDALFNMGVAHSDLNHYEKAIECFKKAIEAPNYNTPGDAWNNMGNTYRGLNNHEKAIECYKKAIEAPNFNTPGDALFNMGTAYSDLNKHEKAIECYKKVLEDPNFNSPGNALNNMGVAYSDLNKHEKAIECYKKALKIPHFDTPGYALSNMGIAYRDLCDTEKALKYFEKAKIAFEEKQDFSKANDTQIRIAQLKGVTLNSSDKAKIEKFEGKENAISEPSDMSNKSSRTEKTPEATLKDVIAKQTKDIYNSYHSRYEEKDMEKQSQNCFIALRETSSSVCFVPTSDGDTHRGGGYFLRWRGFGIVIDPGYDFLRNFHEADFQIKDINVVIISHDHPDHNLDLSAIDDLFYEMNTRYPGEYSYTLLCDNDTDSRRALSVSSRSHREVLPFIHSFKRYIADDGFDLREPNDDKLKKLPFRVESFNAEHSVDVPNAVGFKIKCFNDDGSIGFTLGYTGDTAYYPELASHLDDCDILLANMSQPDDNELTRYIEPTDGKWNKKKNHLGYYGTIGLIKEAKPKLAVIGEFWEGLGDARIEMIRALRERVGHEMVLPADRGMEIDIKNWMIKCSACDEFKAIDDLTNFKIVRPTKEFDSLRPFCKDCIA